MLTWVFFSIAVFALLLRDLSYHPSLWSSKTRRWSMQIQVSVQFNYAICWRYLLYGFVSRTPSLAWTTLFFTCILMVGYIGMICVALWNQHNGSPVELYCFVSVHANNSIKKIIIILSTSQYKVVVLAKETNL